MFLVSSLVSSYSFRFIQNGFIFFFVLAIAAKLLYPKPAERIGYSVSTSHFRLGAGLGMAACFILLAYSTVRVTSSYFVREAHLATSLEAAVPSLEVAAKFDPENPDAEHVYGMWLIKERRFAEAIPHLQRMIGLGFATSPKFSYLATAEILSGDAEGAEKTLEHAAILYPRSTFVLTRYAAILRANGKHAQATAEMSRAQAIDVKAANSWWTLINDGPQAATEAAFHSDDRTEVMDLTPVEGIFAILDEREIMYPGERSKIPF
jgi:tetratricopeptide (TPR) repeat protein